LRLISIVYILAFNTRGYPASRARLCYLCSANICIIYISFFFLINGGTVATNPAYILVRFKDRWNQVHFC